MTTTLLTLEGVNTRQANSARGPFTIYEVVAGGVAYRARKDLFDMASTIPVGTQLYAETRQEQKGEWLNHYIDSIVQMAQAGIVAPPQLQAATYQAGYQPSAPPAQNAQTSGWQQPPNPPVPQPQAFTPTDKDRTIWRQTATKVAADLMTPGDSQDDFWSNVDRLIWFYETGQHDFQDV